MWIDKMAWHGNSTLSKFGASPHTIPKRIFEIPYFESDSDNLPEKIISNHGLNKPERSMLRQEEDR